MTNHKEETHGLTLTDHLLKVKPLSNFSKWKVVSIYKRSSMIKRHFGEYKERFGSVVEANKANKVGNYLITTLNPKIQLSNFFTQLISMITIPTIQELKEDYTRIDCQKYLPSCSHAMKKSKLLCART
jgi:hypothetical protein